MIQAKKSLGQNFLKSGAALDAIVNCSEISTTDTIVEIGPGEGALTEKLLNTGAKIIAIEKDDRLIEILNTKFAKYLNKSFTLIHADILDVDLKQFGTDYKVIANIPYYITGLIIRKIVDENTAQMMTLLVQKEVAERAVARDKKESLLSLSIQSYGAAKYIKTVPRGSFAPMPNVDSAILNVKKHDENIFKDANEIAYYFTLIHAGFAHKRKTLLNNLNTYNKEKTWVNFIDSKIRAEDVHFDAWIKLVRDTI